MVFAMLEAASPSPAASCDPRHDDPCRRGNLFLVHCGGEVDVDLDVMLLTISGELLTVSGEHVLHPRG
jgi:hypothetical protein